MKSWKPWAFLLLVLGIHSFAADYYYQAFPRETIALLYADLIRDFVFLAFALSGHLVVLAGYTVYMFFFSFLPTLAYVPNYPYLGPLLPEFMSLFSVLTWVVYAVFFFLLGKQVVHLLRHRSWGVTIDKGRESWLSFCLARSWIIMFPIAFVLEMHGWRGLFINHVLPISGVWPVLLVGFLMLGAFAHVRICLLLSALAVLGTAANLVALLVVQHVPVTNWPYLLFRLGVPVLASISLAWDWRRCRDSFRQK